ncbi:carboxysome shell carbonic anhydrase [Alkalimonas collagenimarina]|uniref:Carboxysome shell carbonic anhydrase n=1 Tax=Alkalimonas collagenimarina TaxID=400390 RepID=A0ABT9GY09_9GAMM|nr:carboxysome shell carbonic anhydrase domain-containg protein [Alkalimonas collagenimarina]MDP4535936.1 carboxysome shell carbonic anhydrase [Alkalimonas collagenimarina]
MTMHLAPITDKLNWLQQLASHYHQDFISEQQRQLRRQYQAFHPTAIIAFKCMDGRIHLPHATRIPTGVIQPFRNLGGIFDLGWPYLGDLLAEQVQAAWQQGRPVLVLISYHFSKGNKQRGCAGFDCDRAAAEQQARLLQQQFRQLYPNQHWLYPLVCGFETDLDALVLHGSEQQLDLASMSALQQSRAPELVRQLLPDMPAQLVQDLLPLVQGNLAHIAAMRQHRRQPDSEHREWMLCIGRGFDFLHVPNTALIIGPFSPDLAQPIRQAAAIIAENMRAGRIADDGFLLLSSAPYQQLGPDQARAALKSAFLYQFAAKVVADFDPALAKKMHGRQATLHWPERALYWQPQL